VIATNTLPNIRSKIRVVFSDNAQAEDILQRIVG